MDSLIMDSRFIALLIIVALMTGCTGMPEVGQKYERIPEEKPVVTVPKNIPVPVAIPAPGVVETGQPVTGSLYRANYPVQIFSDRRAYRIGDILTIKIEGEAKFSKDSDTTLDKNGSLNLSAPTVFGQTRPQLGIDIKPTRQSKGASKFSRNSSQNGVIAVQVVSVLPNGALKVQGEKWFQLNNEAEFVRVSGILRPEDISTNNEVSSTKLAQARVTYSGIGSQADVHEPGWLTKSVNSPWFPF